MRNRSTGYLALAFAAGLAVHGSLLAQEMNLPKRAEQQQAATRIIVKWSAARVQQKTGFTRTMRAQKATAVAGVSLTAAMDISNNLDVLQLAAPLDEAAVDGIVAKLAADPDVEYASPDLHRHIHAVTNDSLLQDQWYLLSAQPAATRTEVAWDTTQGSPATVVAVLDTGARFDHPDLGPVATGGKLLPGYDFISNPLVANDGNARDADATDTGDWVSSTDKSQQVFSNCDVEGSSWHGTRVAGLIAAATNNGDGVAGAAWNTRILPVRVLGKCGGFDSDIIAGMRWAAGLPVTNVPNNPNPAKVINLSLGSEGACTAAYQAAVNEVIAQGVLIVVSAGNEGGPVNTPANCQGVLGVAGLRHIGTKVGFSSLGPQIGLGAPGGNCVNLNTDEECLFSIVVASNSGATEPEMSVYTGHYLLPSGTLKDGRSSYNLGTSFSAPLVAATAALMNTVNPSVTPAQTIALLKASASAFPASTAVPTCHVPASTADIQNTECTCTTATCGAGMLNSGAAISFMQRPLGVPSITGSVVSGGSIQASGAGSYAASGHSISKYEWSVANITGATPVVVSPGQMETAVQIPSDSQFTLRLSVTDDTGTQDTRELVLSTPPPATPPAQPAAIPPVVKKGGGELGWELLGGLLLLMRRRSRGQSSTRSGDDCPLSPS